MPAVSHLFEIEVFVTLVKKGSFSATGEEMGISSSYASKLISRLEKRLGVRLLHRTTRKLTLTEAGERLAEECGQALEAVVAAESSIVEQTSALRGRLRMTLPTAIGTWLTPHIADFNLAHPNLSVSLVYLDRFVDLIDEGFDIAIRAGELSDSSLTIRKLATTTRFIVASSAYLERHGQPASPEELSQHNCIFYSNHSTPRVWELRRGDDVRRVTVDGSLEVNSGAAIAAAVARGLGLAYIPHFHTARYLADGSLRRVLPEWGVPIPIYAVFPSGRFVPRKVRGMLAALTEVLSAAPWEQL